MGKGMFASTFIPAYTTIISESPLVIVPKSNNVYYNDISLAIHLDKVPKDKVSKLRALRKLKLSGFSFFRKMHKTEPDI
jgi:hypothetical protein